MILSETLFLSDQPLGKLIEDTNTRRVRFQPVAGHTRLARRKWRNVNVCRRAVLKTCQQEKTI